MSRIYTTTCPLYICPRVVGIRRKIRSARGVTRVSLSRNLALRDSESEHHSPDVNLNSSARSYRDYHTILEIPPLYFINSLLNGLPPFCSLPPLFFLLTTNPLNDVSTLAVCAGALISSKGILLNRYYAASTRHSSHIGEQSRENVCDFGSRILDHSASRSIGAIVSGFSARCSASLTRLTR